MASEFEDSLGGLTEVGIGIATGNPVLIAKGVVDAVKGVFSGRKARKRRRAAERAQIEARKQQAERARIIREITVKEQTRLLAESNRIEGERNAAIQLLREARPQGDEQASLEAQEITYGLQRTRTTATVPPPLYQPTTQTSYPPKEADLLVPEWVAPKGTSTQQQKIQVRSQSTTPTSG